MVAFDFNTQIPAANDDPAFDQPQMQTNNLSTANLIAVDHVGFKNNDGGAHTRVQLKNIPNPGQVPTGGYGNGFLTLFSDVVNGVDQLFMVRDAGVAADRIQLTGPFTPNTTGNSGKNGYTFLPGGILLQWGSILTIGGNTPVLFATSNINFPTNCFTVSLTVNSGSISSGAIYSAISVTTSGFNLIVTPSLIPAGRNFFWTAIGN
jgi:hypothetical protein